MNRKEINRQKREEIRQNRRELLSLLINADSDLSYLICRGGIKWEDFEDKNLKDKLLKTVSSLRRFSENFDELIFRKY